MEHILNKMQAARLGRRQSLLDRVVPEEGRMAVLEELRSIYAAALEIENEAIHKTLEWVHLHKDTARDEQRSLAMDINTLNLHRINRIKEIARESRRFLQLKNEEPDLTESQMREAKTWLHNVIAEFVFPLGSTSELCNAQVRIKASMLHEWKQRSRYDELVNDLDTAKLRLESSSARAEEQEKIFQQRIMDADLAAMTRRERDATHLRLLEDKKEIFEAELVAEEERRRSQLDSELQERKTAHTLALTAEMESLHSGVDAAWTEILQGMKYIAKRENELLRKQNEQVEEEKKIRARREREAQEEEQRLNTLRTTKMREWSEGGQKPMDARNESINAHEDGLGQCEKKSISRRQSLDAEQKSKEAAWSKRRAEVAQKEAQLAQREAEIARKEAQVDSEESILLESNGQNQDELNAVWDHYTSQVERLRDILASEQELFASEKEAFAIHKSDIEALRKRNEAALQSARDSFAREQESFENQKTAFNLQVYSFKEEKRLLEEAKAELEKAKGVIRVEKEILEREMTALREKDENLAEREVEIRKACADNDIERKQIGLEREKMQLEIDRARHQDSVRLKNANIDLKEKELNVKSKEGAFKVSAPQSLAKRTLSDATAPAAKRHQSEEFSIRPGGAPAFEVQGEKEGDASSVQLVEQPEEVEEEE